MRGLRALLGRSKSGGDRAPRLSVVVPVHNVERYLAECLDTLLGQSYADFEAILVDDGATDRSGVIAERYAREDPRIRVIRQQNAGLGAARNVGVAQARGEYLTFLDSDDLLPLDAYSVMMSTIERTGSDLVVGTLRRDDGRRRSTMRLMRANHRERRESITLEEMPLILADVFAVNKIFRRSFWDTAGLKFPEQMLYEDQPTLTAAFLEARTFDVITETVYLWRVRGDGSSITQGRHTLEDLLDRLESKRVSTMLVQGSDRPQLHDVWFRDILPVDMWEYFRSVPGCSDDYWTALRSAVAEFWSPHTVPFEQTRIPVQQRLMGWLVGQGRRSELERLITFLDHRAGDIPLEVREGKAIAQLPGVDDPDAGLPEAVYVLGDHER